MLFLVRSFENQAKIELFFIKGCLISMALIIWIKTEAIPVGENQEKIEKLIKAYGELKKPLEDIFSFTEGMASLFVSTPTSYKMLE